MEIEREGSFLFELDDDGTNRWWAHVQSTRINSSECAKIARELKLRHEAFESVFAEVVGALKHQLCSEVCDGHSDGTVCTVECVTDPNHSCGKCRRCAALVAVEKLSKGE